MDQFTEFFKWFWDLVQTKHQQGVYQSVCLGILIALPFLVLLILAVICCHCCCGCGMRKGSSDVTPRAKSEKRKKKKKEEEDLWISAHPKSMLLEKVSSLPV